MRKPVWALALLLAAVALATGGCAGRGREGLGERVSVVTTAYPLEFFARQIGGDAVEVRNLVPLGVEPHEWEPSPRDMADIGAGDLFVYNGAGLDPWAERALAAVQSPNLVVVEATRGMDLISASEGQAGEATTDPHVWLDPILATQEATAVRDGLIRVAPGQQKVFEENAQRLAQRLGELDQRYREGLAQCGRRTVIASHAFLGYLASRYDFQVIAIAGISTDVEPSPAQLASIAQQARELGQRYIFVEPLVSPALAKTLAREVGAQTIVLNPVEGLTRDDVAAGKDYFSIMAENLEALRLAMECR
ncbi:MAG: zinc ABC transporter substrate-binding protein [Chloroflexi bacterium]|nr:zinc ABC transporter substrate-binding protein [Chloroflexota bacterium]